MRFTKLHPFVSFLLVCLILASCQSNTPAPQETPVVPTAPATEAALPQPTITQTAVQSRSLVVCLQDEPASLYLYGGNSRSMWSVLEAIYDGPIDTRGYSAQPVILQKLPSLTDGDAVLKPVEVKAGDPVVDINGSLVALAAGTKVLPSGCSSSDCAQSWDGTSALSMDQLVVTFRLLSGLKWSDGSPLTAADSVFSYQIAADPATPASKYLTDRTVSYKAASDDQSVEWTGMPGFYEQRFNTFFWSPLPKHALGTKGAAQLLKDDAASRSPLGWGPYIIQEWTPGDHITLGKNPNYFRAVEGLPKFDKLVYRFIGTAADGNLNGLLSKECDIVDQNPQFLEMLPGLIQRETDKKLKIFVGEGSEWEHLDFGIRPAAYDDGYNPADGDRPDLFGDVRTRQAVAYCIDRNSIVSKFLYKRSSVPETFLPPSHPLAQKGLTTYAFDPEAGKKLLDEVGWKDTDNDPATPRVAAGVQGVPDGTPLSFTYATSSAALRKQVAGEIARSLMSSCGIEAKVQLSNPGVLFNAGPDGVVFGRKFDVVQFSWEASARPNCTLYSSSQIPGPANHWIGTNITGYNNAEFDSACAAAFYARPSDADYLQRNQKVQALFAQELPVIPLYSLVKVAIAQPNICGLDMDVTARSIFWNLEQMDSGVCK